MASRSVRKQKENEEQQQEQQQENGAEEQQESAPSFELIDKLQDFGVNASDLTKLKNAGCHTIASLIMRTRKSLTEIKGITEAKVDKILEAVANFQQSSFMTGADMLIKRKEVTRITTGSKALDELLGGGVETMSITEIFGEFRTGKTQLCHTLCVAAQLPTSMGGGNGKAAYIDTEGTFRPERIVPIAKRFGLDENATLDNIIYARAYTHEHQLKLIMEVAAKMVEENFKLLVIDSVTALFRVDFSGRGELADRQQKLGQMLSKLMKTAEEFNVAVIVTNQVVSDPGGGVGVAFAEKKPIGGNIMGHASTTRLSLKKGRGETRICKIYDSPCLPESEATFQISEQGIIDAKD